MRVGLNLLHLVPGEIGWQRDLCPAAHPCPARGGEGASVDALRGNRRDRILAWGGLVVRCRDRRDPAECTQPRAPRGRGADAAAPRRASRADRPPAQPLHDGAGLATRAAGDDDPRRDLQAISRDASGASDLWNEAARAAFCETLTTRADAFRGREGRHRAVPRRLPGTGRRDVSRPGNPRRHDPGRRAASAAASRAPGWAARPDRLGETPAQEPGAPDRRRRAPALPRDARRPWATRPHSRIR